MLTSAAQSSLILPNTGAQNASRSKAAYKCCLDNQAAVKALPVASASAASIIRCPILSEQALLNLGKNADLEKHTDHVKKVVKLKAYMHTTL